MNRKRLQDFAPEFADEIRQSLIADGDIDLADQVESLEILDFCDCGQKNCSTFYTLPKPEKSYGPTHENIIIDSKMGLVVLDVENKKIVCVEILDRPDVKMKLS